AFAIRTADEVVLQYERKRSLRRRRLPLDLHRPLRLGTRTLTKSSGDERACDVRVMTRFVRMQRHHLPVLRERAGNVARVELHFSGVVEADEDALPVVVHRLAHFFEFRWREPALAGVERELADDDTIGAELVLLGKRRVSE